jgi:hypothetical protein
MAKFVGFEPKPKTVKMAEDFENKVWIRLNNKRLISKVYADFSEENWALAFAYNQVTNPGLFGSENDLEVKYTYSSAPEPKLMRLDTREDEEKNLTADSFDSPDSFVIWVLNNERKLITKPT